MNSNQLKRDACREMHTKLSARAAYLLAMKDRMQGRDFPPFDPLYRDTLEAYDALCKVLQRLHELSLRRTGYEVPRHSQA